MSNFNFNCPHCSQSLEVSEDELSTEVVCPSCKGEIKLPDAVPPQKQTKSCPYCAEQILLSAVKCKHCGEFLDPALRTSAQQVSQPAQQKKRSGCSGLGCAFVFIASVALAIFFIINSFDTSEPSPSSVSIGSAGRLDAETSGTDIILAVSKSACDDMCVAGSDKALALMVLNGKCFLAPKGTRVQVLEKSSGASRVMVLDGPTIGREGWCLSKFVR